MPVFHTEINCYRYIQKRDVAQREAGAEFDRGYPYGVPVTSTISRPTTPTTFATLYVAATVKIAMALLSTGATARIEPKPPSSPKHSHIVDRTRHLKGLVVAL